MSSDVISSPHRYTIPDEVGNLTYLKEFEWGRLNGTLPQTLSMIAGLQRIVVGDFIHGIFLFIANYIAPGSNPYAPQYILRTAGAPDYGDQSGLRFLVIGPVIPPWISDLTDLERLEIYSMDRYSATRGYCANGTFPPGTEKLVNMKFIDIRGTPSLFLS